MDSSKGRKKILVVDDDVDTTGLLDIYLAKNQYHVLTAANGQDALLKVYTEHPDLIIADLIMPQMDGDLMIKKIKKDPHFCNIPVILLSALDSNKADGDLIQMTDAYILKPFDGKALLAKIRELLQEKISPKTILVIDDEQDILKIIETRLKADGYGVITATNGIEGLDKARKELPDLIILDVMLPKMDGYHVCRILKFDVKYRSIPILILTVRRNPLDQETLREINVDAFLNKPFDMAELLEKVKELTKSEISESV